MKIPREIEIEDYIKDSLAEKFEIFCFSVLYTECYGSPRISVTLFGREDLIELLDILKYKSRCDKTGYTIFYDKNTILFCHQAKDHFFSILKND